MQEVNTLIETGKLTDPQSPRGRILWKAAHLFKEKGFERTTMRDLASEVGIQSGSIFHHFKTKQDILKEIMQEAIIYNLAIMRASLNNASSTEDKLRALILCELKSVNGVTTEAMSVLVYEWRSLSKDNQKDILSLREEYEAIWMEVIEAGIKEGWISNDAFILRRLLTGAISWTVSWFKSGGEMDLGQLADEVLLLVRG